MAARSTRARPTASARPDRARGGARRRRPRHPPRSARAQVHDHELAALAVADEGVVAVGGDRGERGAPSPRSTRRTRAGRTVSSDSAPAVGWATTTCPPGPLSMLRGSSTVASRRCTSRGEADDDDVRLGVGGGQRERLGAGGRPPPGERRERGQAKAEERAAIEVHACHTARGAAGRSRGRQGASTSTLASSRRGPSWTRRWRRAPPPRRRWPTAPPSRPVHGAARPRRRPQRPARCARARRRRRGRRSRRARSSRGPVSLGGSSRSSPRTGPSPPSSARRPRWACQTMGAGWPQRSHASDEEDRPSWRGRRS